MIDQRNPNPRTLRELLQGGTRRTGKVGQPLVTKNVTSGAYGSTIMLASLSGSAPRSDSSVGNTSLNGLASKISISDPHMTIYPISKLLIPQEYGSGMKSKDFLTESLNPKSNGLKNISPEKEPSPLLISGGLVTPVTIV